MTVRWLTGKKPCTPSLLPAGLGERIKKIWVPVSSYLIEHPKGLVLVDTGWHEEIRLNQKKTSGAFGVLDV